VLKWVGTVTCVVILALAAVSNRWHIMLVGKDWCQQIGIWRGRVDFVWDCPPRGPKWGPAGLKIRRIGNPAAKWLWTPWFRTDERVPATRLFGKQVSLPLWLPVAAIAASTAYLWRADRRRPPPGHCQHCGYDLTGNVSGRCPECGTWI
jgi:hypothetical protein